MVIQNSFKLMCYNFLHVCNPVKFLHNHMYGKPVCILPDLSEWLSITPKQTDLYIFFYYDIMQYLMCDHVPVVEQCFSSKLHVNI